MRLFFDIENFVSYISSIYSDNVSITEDLLKLDRIVRNQEIHINNYESPFEKKSYKELPNDKLERVSEYLQRDSDESDDLRTIFKSLIVCQIYVLLISCIKPMITYRIARGTLLNAKTK